MRTLALLALLLAAPAFGQALTDEEAAKVTGSLYGVIQDRLPVVVVVEFRAPDEQAINREHRDNKAARLHEKRRHFSDQRMRLLGRIRGEGVTVLKDFDNLPVLSLLISTPSALKRLLSDEDVIGVSSDTDLKVTMIESMPLVRQPTAIANGHDGAGSAVAVIDTGVLQSMADAGFMAEQLDFTGENHPVDNNGHGSVVISIVHDIAPRAQLLSLKAGGITTQPGQHPAGTMSTTAVIAAIDWTIVNQERYSIAAVNMSFGSDRGYAGVCSTELSRQMKRIADADMVPVVSSGNGGIKSGLSEPACAEEALSVGAYYDKDRGVMFAANGCSDDTGPFLVACWSNSGPLLDIIAPGCWIVPLGWAWNPNHECGTSMAAPFVAGAVAIIRGTKGEPTATATDIMTAIKALPNTITDIANDLSRPALDIPAAMVLARASPGGSAGAPWSPARIAATTASVIIPIVSLELLQ